MLVSYSLNYGPITARVYNTETTWRVRIQLLGSEGSRRGILDLTTAKNAAISYCRSRKLGPRVIQAETARVHFGCIDDSDVHAHRLGLGLIPEWGLWESK